MPPSPPLAQAAGPNYIVEGLIFAVLTAATLFAVCRQSRRS